MKINLENILAERYRIMSSFSTPIEKTALLATDITDHRYWMEKVYHGMLHEAGVSDGCCRRFEKMFGWN